MKIIVNKNDFVGALKSVSRAVSTKLPLPILTGIKICADKDLVLTGTDLELGIACSIEADVKETGTLILPAKSLVEFIDKMPPGPVILESDGNNAVIKYCKSEARINGYSPEEYPEPPDVKAKANFCTTADVLRDTIGRVVYAASIDSPNQAMRGVFFEVDFGELTLVATDGYRLAVANAELDSASGDASIIVPKRAMEEIMKLLKGKEKITINAGEQLIEINFGNLTMTSTLLTGPYPDYKRVIPSDTVSKISVEAQAMKESVDRVSLLCADVQKPVINIKAAGEALVVSGRSETGAVREDVDLVTVGDMEFNVNARFLNDAVKSMMTKEVVFEYIDTLKPVLVKPSEGKGLAIVLPVRMAG
ncbi:DNA polymerase III subunit beta [Pelotomaculum propionicicum]|uniref:DNA polymerase III subunit beta n=1 Tax=Pelotomaculum propionicicum TaxID=258475 RepID=UPI003B810141